MKQLLELYRSALLDDVVPFWSQHAPDREWGGYYSYLDRTGDVYGTDKPVWLQARAVWMYSKLYNTVEPRPEWLELAALGYKFIAQHAFDTDGRAFFLLTRDGKPLRKRRYLFSESFLTIACAEYGEAAKDHSATLRAKDTFDLLLSLHQAGGIEPKVIPTTRPMKSLAMPMIMIGTVQELRRHAEIPLYDEVADACIKEILDHFCKHERQALLETVGPNGEELFDNPMGRVVNPGHAVETSWFLMHAARYRGSTEMRKRALEILDWSLDLGWDWKYGGLLSFVDIDGKPPEQLEWDMKLWWPHCEALYATLLAHQLTGEDKYLEWFERIHAYTFDHFPDPAGGEWFGYLNRDGSVSLDMKGGLWKGMYHVPRALWFCMNLLEEMMIEHPATGVQ
jgi:N-acylglucosamine 2-epimerase